MASSKPHQNKDSNSRPRYGNNGTRLSQAPKSTNQSNGSFYSSNSSRNQQRGSNKNDCDNQSSSCHDSMSQSNIKDDEENYYAVNLQLKPVEMGITGKNHLWSQEFKGLGAFKHYFGVCTPSSDLRHGLPDIWDGYFHITVAKFTTEIPPDQLENDFIEFKPSLENLTKISNTVFRTRTIETRPGTYRRKSREKIDFIVLPLDSSTETKTFYENLQPLLEEIKKNVKHPNWKLVPYDDLHVTVRKYSNINYDINQIKIHEFPLEFRCSHLEVKQTRDQATSRFKSSSKNTYRWWTGVTEIDRKCSGCNKPIMPREWEGFCLACGKYESLIPIWSTDGENIWNYQQMLDLERNSDKIVDALSEQLNSSKV